MTAGTRTTRSQSPGRRLTRSRLARLVSQEALPTLTQDDDGKRSPQYVSGCEDDDGQVLLEKGRDSERSESPMRCVSEFDEVLAVGGKQTDDEFEESAQEDQKDSSSQVPPLPNPLHNARLRSTHVRAIRLEAELQPMRMILGRLMAHPTNKKGLFNAPVNAIALGLMDYHQIIKRPMDLGTIKSMLYSIAYQSRQQVADDIRLVFENAMLYNPPKNVVHMAARSLQDFFEELYAAVGGDKRTPSSCATRHVSFAQESSFQGPLPTPVPMQCEPVAMGITRTVSSTEADLMSVASSISEQESTLAPISEEAPISALADVPETGITSSPANGRACIDPNQLCVDPNNPQSTRAKACPVALLPPMEIKHHRKRRLSFAGNRKTQGHSCRSCLGRSCLLCEQSCLALEPTLLVCNGGNCAGARIRKGSTYFIAPDGSRQYCQRCFACLPPVLSLSASDNEGTVRYKRNLLKRKNDEEIVEDWLTCSKCEMGVHRICALHNSYANPSEDYTCPSCVAPSPSPVKESGKMRSTAARQTSSSDSDVYTFVTGAGCPLRLSDVADPSFRLGKDVLCADSLPKTDISNFVEEKVRDRLRTSCDLPNVDKTITVRMISDCHRSFKVPDVVRKHFRMPTEDDGDDVLSPPERVNYKSKAIALFQKVDGLDVCIFCMYVQEYSGDDDYEDGEAPDGLRKSKRVYVAYLDSVEHFRPRSMRTNVYHEVLVAYLASARQRGFETAHIWACPPSRGNSFVFWNHPASQRTPTKDRLISWYHGALSRALDCGVLTDVKSLYESEFHEVLNGDKGADKENEDSNVPLHSSGRMICPPLLEGDFWIEEAVRIHGASLARHLKARSANEGKPPDSLPAESAVDPCPARQVGSLLIDRLMAHTSCAAFRRPVNAAALKLKDYHKIVTKPMDLGTIYSRCIHGEYACLGDLVADVELVFANAKTFNPSGHAVHTMANEMEEFFFKELNKVVQKWDPKDQEGVKSWKDFASMSMSLDMKVEVVDAVSNSSSMDGIESSDKVNSEPQSESNQTPAAVPSPGCPVEKLLAGGPDAVSQRMVGEDKWMMEKKSPCPKKRPSISKKGGGGKRRRVSVSAALTVEEDPSTKRRRQSWLGEEVGASVRAMRTSFFACSLVPTKSSSEKIQEKSRSFAEYTEGFDFSESSSSEIVTARVADARSSLLEFSQRRNLEFSTLRHAKYSTAVLLYHLHHPDAPGMVPVCTSCDAVTTDCRWHKIVHVKELKKSVNRRPSKVASNTSNDTASALADHDTSKNKAEDLCTACLAKHPQKDLFIPLQVNYHPPSTD